MVAQRKAQQQDTEEMYEGVVRAIRALPRTVIPRLLHEIAQVIEQDADRSSAVQKGNGRQQAALHKALVILTMHQLDHNDNTDEDTLFKAQRVMLNALRDGKLTDEVFARADREAERILVEQGKLTPEQTLSMSEDGESPLLRRAKMHADIPPPTDEQMEQWREEYYKEKYG
jgi:hypothetical protein